MNVARNRMHGKWMAWMSRWRLSSWWCYARRWRLALGGCGSCWIAREIGNYLLGTEIKRSLLTEERANIDRLEAFGKTGIRFVGSNTTHIFCFPTCRYQPREDHLQFFHSEAEARARGYRPCKVCKPAVAS